MIIGLDFTPREKWRLGRIAEQVLDQGHWGNAEMEVPEEHILKDKIRGAAGRMELSLREMELLLTWINTVSGYGTFLLSEDISIISRANTAIAELLASSREREGLESPRIRKTLNMVEELMRHVPRTGAGD